MKEGCLSTVQCLKRVFLNLNDVVNTGQGAFLGNALLPWKARLSLRWLISSQAPFPVQREFALLLVASAQEEVRSYDSGAIRCPPFFIGIDSRIPS